MTIAELRGECKSLLAARIPRDILVITTLVLASFASFGLGFLAATDVGQGSGTALQSATASPLVGVGTGTGPIVASKSGTKYYLSTCSGANRISEANKVWFASPDAAAAAGYSPAINCKGL